MTKEEIKDLLKFIIRKCDLVINNENYTADEYAQDKIEDIAEMCHRVLDGQFGEIIEPSLPSNLDEAAEKEIERFCSDMLNVDIIWARMPLTKRFGLQMAKFGAEWMAGQGEAHELTVESPVLGPPMICCPVHADNGDKVVVQIRKK
jgi:hypothetical protein